MARRSFMQCLPMASSRFSSISPRSN